MTTIRNARGICCLAVAYGRAVAMMCALLVTMLISAPTASAAPQLTFTEFASGAVTASGAPATQAGAHPFEFVTTIRPGEVLDPRLGINVPDGTLKDTTVELPAGVIGNPEAVPQCSQEIMDGGGPTSFIGTDCPVDTQVGVVEVEIAFLFKRNVNIVPIYNMVPPPGEPAQFAFLVSGAIVHVDTAVRTDGDYGANATAHNINAGAPVYFSRIHLWGVPADPAHNSQRFREESETGPNRSTGAISEAPVKPFLRNPTSCTGTATTTLRATAWQEPEIEVETTSGVPATTGCREVPFAPAVSVTPDTKRAGTPAGFSIDLNVPQNEQSGGLASSDLKDVAMTLPAGVAINPGAAKGLGGCGDTEFAISSSREGHCPTASQLGTVEVKTPLLPYPLKGSLYLGAPLEQSPAAAASGRMFRVLLEVEGAGVMIKRSGTVIPDPTTGQLTVTFDNNPQLPFERLHVQLTGGSTAALTTPRSCGVFTTHTLLTPWARPTEPVAVNSSFTIDENCANAASFAPSLEAGTVATRAGVFTPFTMTLTRPDGQRDVSSLSLSLPPGLTGKLAGIPLCPEAQANAGTCSTETQIGKVIAAAGAGSNPLYVPQPGKSPTAVYLAGPYRGASFSLSVVVPAEAGPFDLGTVVVRAALFVDPHNAHVSVVSDPIPTILDGVPLNVQKINVTLDRPGFMLTPTNCNPMQITGAATSLAGSTAALSSPFQVGECNHLKFTPKFSVSTVGKASKANGASLTTKLSFPTNQGTQSNITRVKVELPKQLPSRLTTLQKACTSAQFEANPANCPAASYIGHATVHTPLLPVPLTGPAIFVSHGGEAFPSLVMVLQGDNVKVELVGMTLIRGSVTSTTFKTVPDVPFNDFELTLPQGKYSALGANLPAKANYNFCKQKMVMPTEFIAQNGAVLKRSAPIATTGCPKAKTSTKAKKTKRSRASRLDRAGR